MARIRLFKIAKDLNVGFDTCIDFLHSKNIEVDRNNINVRVSEEDAELLFQRFKRDREASVKSNTYKEKRKEDYKANLIDNEHIIADLISLDEEIDNSSFASSLSGV